MQSRVDDTPPSVKAVLIAGYRRMSAAEKLRRVQALNETALQFAAARIRSEHPGIAERELRLRLASLWLDRSHTRLDSGTTARNADESGHGASTEAHHEDGGPTRSCGPSQSGGPNRDPLRHRRNP